MAQLFLAVDFMHQKGIIHRDLKLPNILFNSGEERNLDLRVGDFGLAVQIIEKEVLFQKCGTPTYIAPEVLNNLGYREKADMFSLGSILFNLVSGKYLFDGKGPQVLINNAECNLDYVPQYIKNISVEG